jgi:peptidoglycan-N-acetylglucosamine deacetylase
MYKIGAAVSHTAIVACGLAAWLAATPARAESCPGNPDALGTSRVMVVSPQEYQRLGTIQYKDTLPLADHEVVLTFDDGPLPPWSNKALDILTSQCVKATFFIIGEMAKTYPDVVRREYEAGYTIGTHSMTHPIGFQRLTGDKLAYQIDGGIAAVTAALGDPDDLSPFFRIPGLGRSPVVEQALADRKLVVFSADADADDWFRHITPAQIVQRAMSRLEKRGRGILLLHDIHPWTVAALPVLLKDLKDGGWHVVQVVAPATAGPVIAGGPGAWARAAAMPLARLIDKGAVSPMWPQPNDHLASAGDELPAPDAATFKSDEAIQPAADIAGDGASIDWPKLSEIATPSSDADFPVPGLADIGVSLHDERLVSTEIATRPALNSPIAIEHAKRAIAHGRVKHVRLRPHPALRHGKADHRAEAPSERGSLAAF